MIFETNNHHNWRKNWDLWMTIVLLTFAILQIWNTYMLLILAIFTWFKVVDTKKKVRSYFSSKSFEINIFTKVIFYIPCNLPSQLRCLKANQWVWENSCSKFDSWDIVLLCHMMECICVDKNYLLVFACNMYIT